MTKIQVMKLLNIKLTEISALSKLLVYFCFLSCLLPIAIFAYKHPSYNWDMLAYMALVMAIENDDIEKVHKATYEHARLNVPTEEYEKLVGGVLRKGRMENTSEFKSILPLYAVKPLYVWLSYGFYKAGFSLPLSTVIPSIIAYLIIGLLLFHWLNRNHRLLFAFAAASIIMYSSVMINVANLSTPDCLSALFLLAAFYFVLERPSVLLSFLFLAGSVLVRLDNIILALLLLTFLHFGVSWKKRIKLFQYIFMVMVLAGVQVLVSGMASNGGDFLYFPTFITYYNPDHHPQSSFSISNYLSLFSERLLMALIYTQVSIFILLVLTMVSVGFAAGVRSLSFEKLFSILLIVIIAIRFILFPNLEDRFYVAFYIVILVLAMQQFKNGINYIKPPNPVNHNS